MADESKEITSTALILSANRALWFEVRPNMRRVSVDYNENENSITLYLYYDKPLSQDELDGDISGAILIEMMCDFPQEINWKDEVIILPYPQKIPDKGQCVFQRYEPLP